MIYTITVTNDKAVLKTLTPFNIDLQNQIWQVTCRNRQKLSNCVVQSHSVPGGTVIFGEADSDKLFAMVLDRYGAIHSECEIPLAGLAKNGNEIAYCYVCDGWENSDGTIVLIAKIVYADENVADDTMLTGRILQGCYLSSEMAAQNVSPIACHSVGTYCWYNQISVFDDKIVCCGQTSSDFNGTVDAMPIVAAYDDSGSILWENTSFTGWTSAYSCFPNGIGSFIAELYDSSGGKTALVSCDLLGQNTGEMVGAIE